MTKVTGGGTLLFFLIGSLVFIDAAALWDGFASHTELSKMACISLSVGRPAYIFIPPSLLDYAKHECPFDVTNAGAGISFLCLKLFLTILASIGQFAYLLFFQFDAAFKRFEAGVEKYHGLSGFLGLITGVIFLLAVFCFHAYLTIDRNPLHYRTDILSKLSEDFICVILYVVLVLIMLAPIFCATEVLRAKSGGDRSL